MNTTSTAFDGSIPENYDAYLGPLLFEFSAKDLAGRVKKMVGESGEVLEIAAGTGVSTKLLRSALPENVSILATDLSEGMLGHARKKRGDLTNVTYEVADALELPYENDRFDVVVCQFGIMFFPDKQKGLGEMMRVVKPGGFVIFNVWDTLEQNSIVELAARVISTFFESEPPKFLHIPFGYNNVTEIKGLMENAGLDAINAEVIAATVEGSSPRDIARGFVTGNPTIIEIQARGTASPEAVVEKVQEEIEKEYGSEPKVDLQEIVFWGTKPR